jgi:hypothetical protein
MRGPADHRAFGERDVPVSPAVLVQRPRWFASRRTVAVLALVAAMGGCSESDDGKRPRSVMLSGVTTCERYGSLALALGCEEPSDCSLPAVCDPEGVRWVDCAATDVAQCLCESSDRNLNCEGSYKPSEGPARCAAEYDAMERCQSAAGGG